MSEPNIKILIIDDSTTNVFILEAIFGSEGYQIITALSVSEAFYCIRKERPDIILLDLNMPEVSGFDFLKKIKADQKTSNIPVIVVSALTDNESISRSLILGAVHFIKKPVDIPLLKKIVSDLLNQI